MKLTNFSIDGDIALDAIGQHWDLHNRVDFAGLELRPQEGAASLRWVVMPEFAAQGLGFSQTNAAKSCAIRFEGILDVSVRWPRGGKDLSNASTLERVGFVVPFASTPDDVIAHGLRIPSTETNAHLLFRFMDDFEIEVAAEIATLIANG